MTLSGRAGVVEEGVEGERAEGFRGRSAAARARPLRCDSRIKVMMYVCILRSLYTPFSSLSVLVRTRSPFTPSRLSSPSFPPTHERFQRLLEQPPT